MARNEMCIFAILIVAGHVSSFQLPAKQLTKPMNIYRVPKGLGFRTNFRVNQHVTMAASDEIGKVSIANALAGPGHPYPFPRTVTQVVSFSVPTALGWYGW
jgi:hypothetical protein